jgi:transglutaminase-like putative cysteine protease
MRRHLTVRHMTEYQYAEPVTFGRHRMMLRPRDSHTLRLVSTSLTIAPKPTSVRWMYDVFGNSVAYAEFGDQRATSLRFVSEISIQHYEVNQPTALLMPSAEQYPFSYDADEIPDIAPLMVLNRPDEQGGLARWAAQIADGSGGRTRAILSAMMETIKGEFQYQRRPKAGTQDPAQTLALRTGSCRDFALLMIEALRSLGFAARFVSGYIYTPGRASHQGGGATHAWVQVYLPGCGWIEIDPTNGIFGNRDLIRIAVARDHKQAAPLTGSFSGPRGAYQGMSISVSVEDQDAGESAA